MNLKDAALTGVELLSCNIMGAPRPKSSPHYPEFNVFNIWTTGKVTTMYHCLDAGTILM